MGSAPPTIARLHESFRLDPATGFIYWRNDRGAGAKAGARAGAAAWKGYRSVTLDGRRLVEHRVIFAMTHGRWPAEQIDHINVVRDDNRPENLREVTHAQNTWNATLSKLNTSGVKGVQRSTRGSSWYGTIWVNGHRLYLGQHKEFELVELIVEEARRKYHGEYARFK